MLSFIARNGGVEVSGAWGCGGSIAASASQYIHHKGGESPALPPHPGVARTADPWALEDAACARSREVTAGCAWTGAGPVIA